MRVIASFSEMSNEKVEIISSRDIVKLLVSYFVFGGDEGEFKGGGVNPVRV